MAGTPSNSRPTSKDGQPVNRPQSQASNASSEVSFVFEGTAVDQLDPHFGGMMKKNTILKKLKTAAGLGDKARKIAAKGQPVKVKGGLIKGKAHVSAKTSDGKVLSVRMREAGGEYLDTVHLLESGKVTFKLSKDQQKATGKTDGTID